MPIKWIRVQHRLTAHFTHIPERVVDSYRRRGWVPVDELDREPQHDQHETATPAGVDEEASSSDDSKENEQ